MESKGNIEIRDAQENDLDAMQEVTLAAYEEYAAVMPPFAWEEYREGMIEAITGKGPVYEKIVATRDGAIVGSVLLLPAGTLLPLPDGTEITLKLPEVRLLAVPPEMRGQGIGAALMKECVRRARQAGVSALSLHTADMMQTAMQMYERMGFVRTPETDFHPAPEIVIKGYRLDLSA
ncbi:MAG TPA: GNAT family N-acetyltransferase [Chloroflexia bacterium]|nr:GNAT family N-acetyltransferase [Chloroflexia bacterium]